jgi:hypothetical protein
MNSVPETLASPSASLTGRHEEGDGDLQESPQGPYGIGRVGASAKGSSGRANGSDRRGELKSAIENAASDAPAPMQNPRRFTTAVTAFQ